MKRRIVSMMLVAAMGTALLAGCGGNTANSSTAEKSNDTAKEDTAPVTETAGTDAETGTSDEGKVLNIYCWNEEFKSRLTDHYPGYTEVDATTGTIGDVTVKWNITPSDDMAYQNNLDAALLKQSDAAADDKIDIFLVEADYALKYVDTDYTMAVTDLGITDEDLSKQYQYTKDVVTNSDGVLKGLSWQGCPGVLFYNRDAAKAVLGSDDPAEVQNYVKDWDTFNDTAKKMKDAGYTITSSVNDTYRVYSNNVSSKWVVDGKINIDDNIMKWVDDSKELVDAGETGTYDMWSDDWKKGFYPEGNVFCYFGPATGTDNQSLVKDILLQMTTNDDVMREIIEKDDDFVNNQDVIVEMADSSYASKILGGQNPLGIYNEGVSKLDLSNLSSYDQGCNEEFQHAMKNYFEGSATKEEALDLFYKSVLEKYPELTY